MVPKESTVEHATAGFPVEARNHKGTFSRLSSPALPIYRPIHQSSPSVCGLNAAIWHRQLTVDFLNPANAGDWIESRTRVDRVGGMLAFADCSLSIDGSESCAHGPCGSSRAERPSRRAPSEASAAVYAADVFGRAPRVAPQPGKQGGKA